MKKPFQSEIGNFFYQIFDFMSELNIKKFDKKSLQVTAGFSILK